MPDELELQYAPDELLRVSDFYKPWPKQAAFHALPVKHRLHVGGFGSGKSKPLMMEAIIMCMDYPGINAVILRKTIPDLKRTVIDKFDADVPKSLYERGSQERGTYNKSDHIVYFPPVLCDDYNMETGEQIFNEDGTAKRVWKQSKLWFAACERIEDVGKFLSTEFAFIGFEELGEFPYMIYDAMEGRNRSTVHGVIPVMAGVSNPMGIGWGWMKKLWIDGKPIFGMDPDKFVKEDYAYIHSTVEDNPILIRDRAYVDSLEKSPLREKIRYGNIETVSGQYFANFEPLRHILPASAFIFEFWQPVWVGWDYGFGHWAVITFWTKAVLKPRFEGEKPRIVNVMLKEIVLKEKVVEEQAAALIMAIPRTYDETGRDTGYAWQIDAIHFSWERFNKTTKDKYGNLVSAADQAGDILAAAGIVRPSKSNTDRISGWIKMYSLLEFDEMFFLQGPDTQTCSEALPLLVRGNGITVSAEDVVKPKEPSLPDDCGDSMRYAVAGSLLAEGDKPEELKLREKLAGISDPMRRHMVAYKDYNEKMAAQRKPPGEKIVPSWQRRVGSQ
jgi:hypothetical protein